MSATLAVDLRTSTVKVSVPISFRLELVGEEATARTRWIGSMLRRKGTGTVYEVPRVNYGYRWYSIDDGAELEEKVGLFGGLV